ncbi:TetR family transcriptional regulator [Tistrella bauzanensis]|uniref:TetR family transcriptional regulator n=1 Tax=Tistrella bauzanensis TaxID=657419 RepID=A0ABQ1J0R9_9PROT|nr:TetR family transcriptional regulator [Tistrella bauzanensis]GGB57329.1 TetR family transcriptional regulator [Tistrella bauzanensis]
MARRTKEDAEKTRQQIMDAAASVFDAEGVARCALEHIARNAGVTRGAIYWHFKNKADLLDAMLERVRLPQERVIEDLANGLITDRAPLDLLHEASRDSIAMIVADERRRLVFRLLFTRTDTNDELSVLRNRQSRDRDHFMTVIEAIMRRAADSGDLARGWTPATAGRTCYCLFHGIISDLLMLDCDLVDTELAPALAAVDACMTAIGSRFDPQRQLGSGCMIRLPADPCGA